MRFRLLGLMVLIAAGCGGDGGSGATDGGASGGGAGGDDALHVITLDEGGGPCTLSDVQEEDDCPVAGQCFFPALNMGDESNTSKDCTERAGAIRSVRIYGDEEAGTFDALHVEFLEPGLRARGHWGVNIFFHDPSDDDSLDLIGCDQSDPGDPVEADKEVLSYSQGVEVHATYEALRCRFDGDTLVVETTDVDPRPSTVLFDAALSLYVDTYDLSDDRYDEQNSIVHLYPYSRRAA